MLLGNTIISQDRPFRNRHYELHTAEEYDVITGLRKKPHYLGNGATWGKVTMEYYQHIAPLHSDLATQPPRMCVCVCVVVCVCSISIWLVGFCRRFKSPHLFHTSSQLYIFFLC